MCSRRVRQEKRYNYLDRIVRPQPMYALAFRFIGRVHGHDSSILPWSTPDGTSPAQPESSEMAGKYAGHRHDCTSCSSFASGSGRNHSETWVGCIVSLTTPTRSSLKASRSVSSRILAEKVSCVFLVLYFLL
jgi:hypothetical protein